MPGKLAAPSCHRPRRQRRERSHRHRRSHRRHHHRSQARRATRHGRSARSAENSPSAMGRGRAVRAAEHDRALEDRWRERGRGRLRLYTARFLGPAPLPAGVYKDIPLNYRVVLAW